MIPTEVDYYSMQFDVNAPQFLKEACENCNGGLYAICWNIFREMVGKVATRAAEINDPVMNILMLRMNLYEMEGSNEGEKNKNRVKAIKEIIKQIKS